MISIRGLVKQFRMADGTVTAINGLDLEVAEGEFYVIVGASGSGKTTLLRCVAGLESPDAGEITLAGRTVSSDNPPCWVPPQHRRLGMVFQSYAVWPHMTVYDNVALPLTDGVQRIPRREVAARVHEALEMVELDHVARRPATLLSGGQQQRVALARAIAVNSKMLLMDEPLSNLDARLREDVRGRIRDLAKQLGSTVLYVTHDQVEAMAVADTIALLQQGELLQAGSPAELYRTPMRTEVAEFFGAMNWLAGSLVGPGVAETAIGRLCFSGSCEGAQVRLGFRPEALQPADSSGSLTLAPSRSYSDGERDGRGDNVLRGSLVSSTFLGDQFLFRVQVQDQVLLGKSRLQPVEHEGSIQLAVDPAEIMIFPEA
ncbi:MAG TPA: ABC transporter ATP-binding protein [Chloroflexota bacterium]|nr:ABC transporter ATP-binding protein [Chloroflexota bacterium]